MPGLGLGLGLTMGRGRSLTPRAEVIAFSDVYLDLNDATTRKQERTGASATTAAGAGDALGSLQNLGGDGGWFTAASDAARPVLADDAGTIYAAPDGVDDWMTLSGQDLGDQWWHVGVWLVSANGKSAFATSTDFREAVWRDASLWKVYNPSSAFATIATPGNPGTLNVLTVQKTASDSLSGRYNGAGGQTITPFHNAAATPGLALFSQVVTSFANGMAGRFYAGAWGRGLLSDARRTKAEQLMASIAGVTL